MDNFSKKWLCVYFLRVILHTCLMGFNSGEYGGRKRNLMLLPSSWKKRNAFLRQDVLFIMIEIFFEGWSAWNILTDYMIVL